jgi:rhodanese-related sulfurtransferase
MKSNFVKDILVIVAVSFFFGLTYNYFSPKGIPLIRKEPVKTVVSDSSLFGSDTSITDTVKRDTIRVVQKEEKKEDIPQKEIKQTKKAKESDLKIVTLEQVKRLVNEGKVLLIDARNADEFEKGRIKGAINIPYMEVENYFEKLFEFPTDTLVVIYCNNPDCPLGRGLLKFMEQMEFKKLYLYDDGWDGWVNAGMPIERVEKK